MRIPKPYIACLAVFGALSVIAAIPNALLYLFIFSMPLLGAPGFVVLRQIEESRWELLGQYKRYDVTPEQAKNASRWVRNDSNRKERSLRPHRGRCIA